MSFFHTDVDIQDPNFQPLPEEEMEVLDKFARWVVKWGAAGTVAGIMIGESVRPANFLLSQGMVFAEPIAEPLVRMVFNTKEYAVFYRALEKRSSIEILLQKIEAYDAERAIQEKAVKIWYRYQKKHWNWYQRFFRFFRPGVSYPPWAMRTKALRNWRDGSDQ